MRLRASLLYAGLSDIGLSRPNNEDVWAAFPEMGFFALADGMGGHQAGEVAAKEAIDQLCQMFRPDLQEMEDPAAMLAQAIEAANSRVYERGRQSHRLNGMGTTLCCLYWARDFIVYAHVGDSRIYRLRDGQMKQLTEDHSLLTRWKQQFPNSPAPSPDPNAPPFPYKNVITRAIGTCKRANPEVALSPYLPGDLYVLCSDGLSDALTLQDMERVISRCATLDEAAQRLIEKAKRKGSNDNITVLLVLYPDGKDLFRQ